MTHDFQTIATFWNPNEAQLAKALIEADGVQVVLMGYEAISSDWLLSNAIGGVQLQVPQDQVEKAIAILEDSGPFGRRSLIADSGDSVDHIDSGDHKDGEEVDASDDDSRKLTGKEECIERMSKTSILSWIFFPLSLYALWLFLGVLTQPDPVGKKYARKVWMAVLIVLLPLLLTLEVMRGWLAYVVGGIAR